MIQHLMDEFRDLLRWDFQRFTPAQLTLYCRAIAAAGAPTDRVFGFVDGTVREISRPELNQRLYYNGHKRMHGYKFTAIAFPDGIVCLTGPFVGRPHDLTIWRASGMEDILRQHGKCFSW